MLTTVTMNWQSSICYTTSSKPHHLYDLDNYIILVLNIYVVSHVWYLDVPDTSMPADRKFADDRGWSGPLVAQGEKLDPMAHEVCWASVCIAISVECQ